MLKLSRVNINMPQAVATMMAVERSKIRTGTMKVNANRNLAEKVASVASQISFRVCTFSDSSETWMPKASENASAIAIVNTPPMTTNFEPENECKPTINPSVVITAEVRPKHNPVKIECFNVNLSNGLLRLTLLSFEVYSDIHNPLVNRLNSTQIILFVSG